MKLITPTMKYKTQYLEMLEDWKISNENPVPFSVRYDVNDFPKFIEKTNSFKSIQDEGFVHHSTFWMIDEADRIVAVSNLRHYLNESLLIKGGHIGYGVRPAERRKGYATKILALTLLEAKKLGIRKALVTCDKDNIASSKTIIRNGGILWKEHVVDDVDTLNYWIEIK